MADTTRKNRIRTESGSHNTVIMVIVILAFVVSNLAFWTVNTRVLKDSIQSETKMTASFLVTEMSEGISEKEAIGNLDKNVREDCDVWIADSEDGLEPSMQKAIDPDALQTLVWMGKDNRILLHGDCCVIQPMAAGPPAADSESAAADKQAAAGEDDAAAVSRSRTAATDAPQYLVVINRGYTAKALQRRQFSLLMTIDLILLILMIVLIINNNARYRRQIIRIATTDELTGLANRKYFDETFNDFVADGKHENAAMFLLDVDYFKQINDNYSHSAGDAALRYIGQELKSFVKGLNGFAGRWGGDEFIGIAPLPAEQLYEKLEQLGRGIAEHETEEGFTITVSIGVAELDRELNRALQKTDQALYESKEKGRNQVSLLTSEVPSDHEMESAGFRSVVAQAVAQAEDISIDSDPIRESEKVEHAPGGSFRKRLASYLRDKLIMSTILGVRWMAPFVAGGGILIALAFLFDAVSVDLSSLTVAERAELGSITAISATLKEIGGITFNFMLPIFAAFMAYGIAGEAAFVAGFVGGYMTIDCNAGFVGAMAAGFAAGVLTNEMQQFAKHTPAFVRNAAPIIIFPVFSLILMKILTTLIISPVSEVIERFFTGLLEDVVAYSHLWGGTLSGMMMAIDMGGIINKVSYNFGTAAISSGGTDIMASVMVGGMVPPIGIFLATVLFKRKFTQQECSRGTSTLFMGLSFITEGALPYVFTDIVRVIPSCMAGSAVAGFLSVLFGCTLPAPHGGIFVFPVMGHPLLYIIALAAGSMVTAVLLGVWKKECK